VVGLRFVDSERLYFLVFAGAGVFFVLAAWAVTQVEAELGADLFGIWCHFESDDGRDVIAVGERGVRKERFAVGFFFEAEFGGGLAITANDADGLFRYGNCFVVLSEEGNADFSIFGDKELSMRGDRGDDFSSVGTHYFFGVIVIMTFLGMLMFSFGVVMT
jgi:hypothetical protein